MTSMAQRVCANIKLNLIKDKEVSMVGTSTTSLVISSEEVAAVGVALNLNSTSEEEEVGVTHSGGTSEAEDINTTSSKSNE